MDHRESKGQLKKAKTKMRKLVGFGCILWSASGCDGLNSKLGLDSVQSLPIRVDTSQPAPRLMAVEDGVEFLVHDMASPNFCQGHLQVLGSADLNGDNWLDYLIEESEACGNAMPGTSDFWVVTPKPRGEIIVSNRALGESFLAASAEIVGTVVQVQIETYRGKKSDFEYVFTKEGRLEKRSEVVNATQKAVAVAEVEVTFENWKGGVEDVTIPFDVNGDGQLDWLKCSRFRQIVCNVEMADGTLHSISSMCSRWGILSSSSNGYRDLVCEENLVLRWSGTKWQ